MPYCVQHCSEVVIKGLTEDLSRLTWRKKRNRGCFEWPFGYCQVQKMKGRIETFRGWVDASLWLATNWKDKLQRRSELEQEEKRETLGCKNWMTNAGRFERQNNRNALSYSLISWVNCVRVKWEWREYREYCVNLKEVKRGSMGLEILWLFEALPTL